MMKGMKEEPRKLITVPMLSMARATKMLRKKSETETSSYLLRGIVMYSI